jgi:hypothetical protein
MDESHTGYSLEQNPSSSQSRSTYEEYRKQIFNQLEEEQNPLLVDTEAAELLFLVLRNPDFTPSGRLQEFVNVSQLTMSRMCRYAQESINNPSIVKQAEMIHNTYAQVFAHSIVELTKPTEPQSSLK